jgi:hypothetical protein
MFIDLLGETLASIGSRDHLLQAVLDGKTQITYQTLNGNVYNPEDVMSIRTSITAPAVVEEFELAEAA